MGLFLCMLENIAQLQWIFVRSLAMWLCGQGRFSTFTGSFRTIAGCVSSHSSNYDADWSDPPPERCIISSVFQILVVRSNKALSVCIKQLLVFPMELT